MSFRSVTAGNPSAMTLDGTRTHIVGEKRVVIIDPGPRDKKHLRNVFAVVGAAPVNAILLTHTHPDHAAAADMFAEAFDAPVLSHEYGNLTDGETVPTDQGEVLAVHTPGHTGDSFSFATTDGALFCGDLMMGGLDTALVARPEGNLGKYLASLEKIRARKPRVIVPAHGPDFEDPIDAIDRYIEHRRARLQQVLDAVEGGATDAASVVTVVYGDYIEPALREYAEAAIDAYLQHLRETGRLAMPGAGDV